jgi:hypothetical protein
MVLSGVEHQFTGGAVLTAIPDEALRDDILHVRFPFQSRNRQFGVLQLASEESYLTFFMSKWTNENNHGSGVGWRI